jgi:hypothetical protein
MYSYITSPHYKKVKEWNSEKVEKCHSERQRRIPPLLNYLHNRDRHVAIAPQ